MPSTRFNPLVPTLEEAIGPNGSTIPDVDGTLIPGENDFSSTSNKPTLRSYISSLTKGSVPDVNVSEYAGPIPDHANAYPLERDGDGENTFSQYGFEGQSINVMQDYSNSGLFDDSGNGLQGIINKGRSGRANNGLETLSGHLLLQGVDSREITIDGDPPGRTAGATAYQRAMPEILNNAGFTSPNHPTTETSPAGVSHTSGRFKVRPTTGTLSISENDAPRVSVEDLSKVAIDIMLRATGKDRGADGYGTTGLEAGINTSGVQAGTSRVDVEKLRVGYSDDKNTSRVAGFNPTTSGENDPLPTDDGVGDSRYSNKSYGVTYNPLEPFESFTSGVTTFALLAGGALAGVLAVGGIFSAATKPNKNIPTAIRIKADNSQFLESGRFKFRKSQSAVEALLDTVGIETDIAKLLNIYVPMNPVGDYGQCVILGFASLIGVSYNDFIDLNGNIAMTAGDVLKLAGKIALRFAAIVLTEEKGYYTNIFREILKEAGSLVSNISANPTSLLSANGLAGITNAKIVRFVDTLARLGDALLFQAYTTGKNEPVLWQSIEIERITSIKNAADALSLKKFARGRVRGDKRFDRRGGTLGLADLPSAHLVPDSYKSLVADNSMLGAFTGETAGVGRTNLRLKQEDVRTVESILDAEYMPFYFHDLRTNEIVSFHAFLDELSDSYTANYNASSGYGRIEDVQTYKDTKRSVGCTFHVVGMNEEDFNYMWWQINKLTTMVYPQWSQGRKLQTQMGVGQDDFKFIQPFSQIPTATPVIRFRVGDLIRSNYSRFNLKRLFGYKDTERGQTDSTVLTTPLRYHLEPGFYYIHNGISENPLTFQPQAEMYEVKEKTIPTSVQSGGLVNFGPEKHQGQWLVTIIGESGLPVKLAVPYSQLNPAGNDEYTMNQNSIDFYNPDNNAVVRSFESAAGMGLAAVVTSLNFTWMDAQWGVGEDGPGNRAPRSCKVQMAFTPIHDIAPGLDHEGFNRAPIYPVGGLVNNIIEGGADAEEPYGKFTTTRSKA